MMKTGLMFIALLVMVTTGLASDKVDNPLYSLWSTTPGTALRFDRTETITGGIPRPDNRPSVERSKITYKLEKATAEALTIKIGQGTFSIPSKLDADAKNFPKRTGSEDIEIGDKTYACAVYTYTTSLAETGTGEDPSHDWPVETTVWVNPDVPGGVVRKSMCFTIKATCTIEDTLIIPAPTTRPRL